MDRTSPPLSGFDDWVISDYLVDYYGAIEGDEQHTLQFLVDT